MRYISKNQTGDFEFHDTSIISSLREKEALVLKTMYLCIHKNSANNPFNLDMELSLAKITFQDFKIESYKELGYTKYDPNTKTETKITDIFLYGTEAEEKFNTILENTKEKGLRFNCFEKNDSLYFLEIIYPQGVFSAECIASNILVEWEEFVKPAWYEYENNITDTLILMTQEGEKTVEATVQYDGRYSEDLEPCLSFAFDGKNYFSQKRYYNFDELFAEMQNQLPKGVYIKCCVTCRHGNFCPYGNYPDEIFCTKDVTIKNCGDVCRYTADIEKERQNRLRKSTFCCNDYKIQTEDFFTYNDFLYFLDKYKK